MIPSLTSHSRTLLQDLSTSLPYIIDYPLCTGSVLSAWKPAIPLLSHYCTFFSNSSTISLLPFEQSSPVAVSCLVSSPLLFSLKPIPVRLPSPSVRHRFLVKVTDFHIAKSNDHFSVFILLDLSPSCNTADPSVL